MQESAIDRRPGPLLRALRDTDAALIHMERVRDGVWRLTVRLWAGRKMEVTRETAQGAADAMETQLERMGEK